MHTIIGKEEKANLECIKRHKNHAVNSNLNSL